MKLMQFSIVLLLIIFVMGCTSPTNIVKLSEIAREKDDGAVRIYNAQYNLSIGDLEGEISGVFIGLNNDMTSRGLYRFNISNWEGEDITFNIRCNERTGNPGSLAVYVIDDFGSVSDKQGVDISRYWEFLEGGVLAGEVSPLTNQWMEILIPKNIVESKLDHETIAFMIKLSNENKTEGSGYSLITYEWSILYNFSLPYLTEKFI